MNDVNHAHEGRGPVHDRRRTAQHFDALDVREIERRGIGIERSAPGDTVDDEKKCVEFAQPPHLRNPVIWLVRSAMCDMMPPAAGLPGLADTGIGVVLISHNMNDVMEVADRVDALYLGRIAAEVLKADTSTSQIVELITSGRSGSIGLSAATAAQSA